MLTPETIQQAANQIAVAAYTPVKIILFGSYARVQADAGSDTDFLVVEKEIPDPVNEFLKLHLHMPVRARRQYGESLYRIQP
ncbi:MAG: nucleotidyltransferase domain-containing protein [Methylococcaceae bacterium]